MLLTCTHGHEGLYTTIHLGRVAASHLEPWTRPARNVPPSPGRSEVLPAMVAASYYTLGVPLFLWLLSIYICLVGGWALPLWKIYEWKSVGMMTFHSRMESHIKCSKPPTSLLWFQNLNSCWLLGWVDTRQIDRLVILITDQDDVASRNARSVNLFRMFMTRMMLLLLMVIYIYSHTNRILIAMI